MFPLPNLLPSLTGQTTCERARHGSGGRPSRGSQSGCGPEHVHLKVAQLGIAGDWRTVLFEFTEVKALVAVVGIERPVMVVLMGYVVRLG